MELSWSTSSASFTPKGVISHTDLSGTHVKSKMNTPRSELPWVSAFIPSSIPRCCASARGHLRVDASLYDDPSKAPTSMMHPQYVLRIHRQGSHQSSSRHVALILCIPCFAQPQGFPGSAQPFRGTVMAHVYSSQTGVLLNPLILQNTDMTTNIRALQNLPQMGCWRLENDDWGFTYRTVR